MKRHKVGQVMQVADSEWVAFPGGELEAPRPKVLCPECRAKLAQSARNSGTQTKPAAPRGSHQPLCFQCHRASFERERALRAAGSLDTASEARFQSALPFEAVNRSRLERLKIERSTARTAQQAGAGRYIDKRRHAQIAARHALERIVIGLRERNATRSEEDGAMTRITHAAELQLPEAWLPFVLAR